MGLFDEIRVEKILPDGTEPSDAWYQTKSLECLLDKYIISADGELYRELWEYEWVDDPDSILKGSIKKIEGTYHREYLTDFHGDIIFYGSAADKSNVWRDYYARFTDGKLSKMWYKDTQY